MFLAILLATLTLQFPATEERQGLVVIATAALQFEEPLARKLCPDPMRRLILHMGTADDAPIDPLAGLGAPTPVALIHPSDTYPGDDRDWTARVAPQCCVVLTGGTWLQWWAALKPNGKLTRLGRALVDAQATGTSVIGVGASGLYLSEWSLVSRDALRRPSRNPHDDSQDLILAGLGLARGTCVDLATDGRASPERMFELVSVTRIDRAVWLAGACAWIQDEGARSVTIAAQDGAAFVFDLSRARRSRATLVDVTLSHLQNGAQFDLKLRSVQTSEPEPANAVAERTVPNVATGSLEAFFDGRPVDPGSFQSVAASGDTGRCIK